MKQRKFYIVYLYDGDDNPGNEILSVNTREHGMTEKLLTDIKRELDRKKRQQSTRQVNFLNLIELDA